MERELQTSSSAEVASSRKDGLRLRQQSTDERDPLLFAR
jgi:hypothetical protein